MTTSTNVPPVTGPDEPEHGHRITWKPVLLAALVTLAALGTALGLYFGLGSSGSSSAADLLQGDGYTLTQTVSHHEIEQQAGNGPNAQYVQWFDSGAVGTKGNSTEIVVKLTPQGSDLLGNPVMQTMLAGALGETAPGVTTHMDNGEFLTINGPSRQITGPEGWSSQPPPAMDGTQPTPPDTSTAPVPDANPTGPVGKMYSLSLYSSPVDYSITLTKVTEPAPVDPYSAGDVSGHLATGEITVTCNLGVLDSDYLMSMSIVGVGTNGEVYQPSWVNGSVFPAVSLHEGEHTTGSVSFDIPQGVKLASVRYEPTDVTDITSVTWTIGSADQPTAHP